MKKKVVKTKNTYVIRKTVKANSIIEALKIEKKIAATEVLLISNDGKQLLPAIGFGYNNAHDTDEEK